MERKYLTILVMITAIYCSAQTNNGSNNVQTKKGNVVDTYFGTKVPDPYRWLEDDMSSETAKWVKEQNEQTFSYLDKIPFREKLKEKMTNMYNYEKLESPFDNGKYTYYYKNDGLQNQYVLYRKLKNDNKEEIFLDPNKFSKDGTTSLGEMNFSEDGSIMAYSISEGGSDWRKIITLDTDSKKIIGDTLRDVKFTGISWYKNEGFYYSSYDKPNGSELSAITDQHKLYYHKIGTPQAQDKIIFGNNIKRRFVSGNVTSDNKYLIISASVSTSGNELYIKDLSKKNSDIITIVDNFNNNNTILDSKNGKLYIITDKGAPNSKLVTVDASNPNINNWKDLIPETNNAGVYSIGSGYIFASYMKDAISMVKQYDYKGNLVRDINLPGIGTSTGFSAKKDAKTIYFGFTNYINPNTIYSFNPKSGKIDLYIKPKINFNSDEFESKQIFYVSKDGTKIPMIITYKKGIKLDGNNPTILYGYGGFNISLTPSFSVPKAVWLENGGIYAVANIRGGGEYGNNWHISGTKMNKQNVFDDFIAAAEFLIKEKYTSSNYLAINGGSNGGLLIGAVMTQRPELFKVALPDVGVLDMLRYNKFTAGAGWCFDYGTSDDSKEMFEYLKSYSPLHNVSNVSYPATMIKTGDHDDRVVPAHSFKFAAELQSKNKGNNPILIRIEVNAGHGAGKSVEQQINENADTQSFILFNMGIKDLK